MSNMNDLLAEQVEIASANQRLESILQYKGPTDTLLFAAEKLARVSHLFVKLSERKLRRRYAYHTLSKTQQRELNKITKHVDMLQREKDDVTEVAKNVRAAMERSQELHFIESYIANLKMRVARLNRTVDTATSHLIYAMKLLDRARRRRHSEVGSSSVP